MILTLLKEFVYEYRGNNTYVFQEKKNSFEKGNKFENSRNLELVGAPKPKQNSSC